MPERFRVLIVDDRTCDAAIAGEAVERVTEYLKTERAEIRSVSSLDDAISAIDGTLKPDLVLTDLFLEPNLSDLEVACSEMEWPQGLRLLEYLKQNRVHCHSVVMSFFWDYPGFGRYMDAIHHLGTDTVLPKEILYFVGRLGSGSIDTDKYPPLSILAQAYYDLVTDRSSDCPLDKRMRRIRANSLFAEACSWLHLNSHLATAVRNDVHDEAEPSKRSAPSGYKESAGISESFFARAWMPTFLLELGTKYDDGAKLYHKAMQQLAREDNWRLTMAPPAAIQISAAHGRHNRLHLPSKISGKEADITYFRLTLQSDAYEFLSPTNDDHRALAQLLLTLSFFTYWCHLPDHCAIRTADDLASIMQVRGESPYRNLGLEKAAEAIDEDLDRLDEAIVRIIKKRSWDSWWRYFQRHVIREAGLSVIGNRPHGRQGHYWLNASLIVKPRI